MVEKDLWDHWVQPLTGHHLVNQTTAPSTIFWHFLNTFRELWLHYPGQPVPLFNNPFSENIPPFVQPESPLAQPKAEPHLYHITYWTLKRLPENCYARRREVISSGEGELRVIMAADWLLLILMHFTPTTCCSAFDQSIHQVLAWGVCQAKIGAGVESTVRVMLAWIQNFQNSQINCWAL